SLHDALPISMPPAARKGERCASAASWPASGTIAICDDDLRLGFHWPAGGSSRQDPAGTPAAGSWAAWQSRSGGGAVCHGLRAACIIACRESIGGLGLPKQAVFPNRTRVITERVPGVRSGAVGVRVDAGSRDELPEQDRN